MKGSKNDWFAIAGFGFAAAANQMLWLTFAPITTEAAQHYGVSEDAIGWLAQIFPLLYVVLAIPAGLMLDRWLRPVLVGAAALTAVGGGVRLLQDSYEFALAGQFLVAIAQPAILGAVTKLASERVDADSRTLAISLGSAGIFIGSLLALVLGATVGDANGLQTLLWINAVFAVVSFALIAVALRAPGRFEVTESAAIGVVALRSLWGDHVMRRLSLVAFMGFGVFVAMTTWLQVLLEPDGVSTSEAGWLLVAMTASGVIGSIVMPDAIAKRSAEQQHLRVAAIVCAVALGALAIVTGDSLAVTGVLIVAIGWYLLSALPVLLELTEHRASAAGASAAGAIWLAGNAGGIVLAVIVQLLTDHPSLAFVAMGTIVLAILPIVRGIGKIEPLEALTAN
jgi:predicted MFS family arabinose efflux permease